MLTKSLFAAGALALHTSAFLIPLEVYRESRIPQANQVLKHQTVDLDCPSCPLVGSDGENGYNAEDDSPMSIVCRINL